jgi:ethanolamine utilization protein EutA
MNDFLHEHEDEVPGTDHSVEDYASAFASEVIRLTSVGIDIGSTTTHLIFSHIVLQRLGLALSSRFCPVARDIIYESRILLTPYIDINTLDAEGLSSFISETYDSAGIDPETIDTGAVICTGEATRKENAEAIVSLFSKQAGKFVCATAGPNLEAVMAAQGSAAVKRSRDGTTVMNVDVGGGTSKVAIARDGSIVDTAAINVGARLIAMDEDGRIVRMEEAGRLVAEECGLNLGFGDKIGVEEKDQMARVLASVLFDRLGRRPPSLLGEKLMITPPLSYSGKIDVLMFSGGVSEYIYGREDMDYGDLGINLAGEIRQLAARWSGASTLEEPQQRLRATVIGASQYTVQVSGSTIFVPQNNILPLRNLPVLSPGMGVGQFTPDTIQSAIQRSLRQFDLVEGSQSLAFMFNWSLEPSHELLSIFARGIKSALKNTISKGMPIVLVFNTDVAKSIGYILSHELAIGDNVISVDGIDLQEFDYIDIGEELPPSGAVPVVIKSLVFR